MARAAPGSSAGRRRPRAYASRRSGAGRAARPARRSRPRGPSFSSRRRDVGGREPPAALRDEQRLLAGLGARAPGGRRRQVAAQRPLGGLADRHQRLFAPLPWTRTVSPSKSIARRRGDDLLGSQPAGVGELEHRPVADLERRARGNPVEQRRDLVAGQHARQLRAALRGRQQLGRVARRRRPVATRWSWRLRTAASLRATLAVARRRSERVAAKPRSSR